MAKHQFQFKQFTIQQDQCAMKVSLDACLLGAMVKVDGCQHILDIGTGTGLLALMAAQRCTAHIDAVELDENAFKQAQHNIRNSPYHAQIELFHSDIQHFSPSQTYDLIMCNPPFFSDHLNNPDPKRNLARHNDRLSFAQLSQYIATFLSETGHATLILPVTEHERFMRQARACGLEMVSCMSIQSRPTKNAHRVIFELAKQRTLQGSAEKECNTMSEYTQQTLCIHDDDSTQYSPAFKNWLQPYYLKL